MKTIFLAFFLLLALSTTLPSTTADFVYDTDGEPLFNGGTYHILPVFRGRGGGLELARTGTETCPLTVVQAPSELDQGLPARLSSPILLLYINEGMLLTINFTKVHQCVKQPSQWDVVDGFSVKQANVERFVGPFKIEKYDKFGPHDYKLIYCPEGDDACKDLGIYNRRLVVLDGNPFIVQFKKAIAGSPDLSIV